MWISLREFVTVIMYFETLAYPPFVIVIWRKMRVNI